MLQLTCYHQTGRLMISYISFLPLVGLYVSKTTSNMKIYVTVDFRVYVIQERKRERFRRLGQFHPSTTKVQVK